MNLILITGLPASGKSGFATFAGKRLGLPVLEKDALKEVLFDDIGFHGRDEKMRLGNAAMDLMYYMADQFLKAGSSVILDNNFEASSMPGLTKLMKANPCNVITVRFEGDIKVIHERFVRRDQDPARHRGHIVNTSYPETVPEEPYIPISREEFEAKFRKRGMMDFNAGGTLLIADALALDQQTKEELLKKLREAMEN